jgi:hypothetical protein
VQAFIDISLLSMAASLLTKLGAFHLSPEGSLRSLKVLHRESGKARANWPPEEVTRNSEIEP